MKQQYLRLFSFLIGITFIISGVLFTVVNNYKEEKKKKADEERLIADEIGNVYQTFYDKETALSAYRDAVFKDINNFLVFYTEMPSWYSTINDEIGKYESLLVEVEDISSYLKDNCSERYSVLEANEKCDAYYINLERTINIFVGDVEYLNSRINNYNEWTETENNSAIATQHYDKLEEYKAKKYTHYVDLNDDGTVLGMNKG